jgi:hypothetical protein
MYTGPLKTQHVALKIADQARTRGGVLALRPSLPPRLAGGRRPEGAAWARLCAAPRGAWGPLMPRPRHRRGPRPRRGPLAARRRASSTRPPMAVSPGSARPGAPR